MAEDIGERLAARLSELRRQAGLTQEKLAERTGIAAPEISKFEGARREPTLATLAKLADAYGLSMRDLFEFGDESAEDDELDQIVARLRGQPPEVVRRALAVVDALVRAG